MLKRFVVKKDERGALLRDGDFERILAPGRYRQFDPLGRLSLVTWKLDQPMQQTAIVDYLSKNDPAEAERQFVRMELGDDEAGLRYENGVLAEVLAPGTRRYFWKGLVEQRLDRTDLRQSY